MIAFACRGCGKVFDVDAAWAGREARCKRCGEVTRVPAAPEVAAAPEVGLEPEPTVVPTWVEKAPRRRRPRGVKAAGIADGERPAWGGVGRNGWASLAVGVGLAGVALTVPLVGIVLGTLRTVMHELGHTATAWLLASPAVPQFDLTYGGGYTHIYARHPALVAAAYLALGCAAFGARGNRPALIGWAVLAAAYTAVLATPLRSLAISAMGHGGELVFAGIFLYRALGGRQILHWTERPLYAAIGLFLVLGDARFAFGLLTSDAARTAYGDAKGGGHWMDFDQIAKGVGCPLERVAAVFFVACLLTPVAAYIAHRYGDRLASARRAA